MLKLLLVSHGGLAQAMLESAEMICGPQEDVRALGLFPGDSPDALRESVTEILDRWNGQDVLVLTDIRSGTPFNTMASLMQTYPFRHISGVNLALLIEALMDRDCMSADEVAGELMAVSGQTILDVNLLLEQ
ncbi:MAG: PTS sugar transporter subunit IIA [Eubacteriales bacterium]|nr:PTS sugar transporter subunit IIA [Eubacteriales bacterium]